MSHSIEQLSANFWSIRSPFKIAKVLNIGTQAALVKCSDGKFVMLDTCRFANDVLDEIKRITNGGNDLKVVLNLHPFHTLYVKDVFKQFPHVELYGTERHHQILADLPWQPERTESAECAQMFAPDLEFTVPAGVDFISTNNSVHFSSVLAYHPESKTLYSDDTLMYMRLPGPARRLKKPEVSFHPTLRRVLQPRKGSAVEFRKWAEQMAEQWSDAENLCAAHTANLLAQKNKGAGISQRVLRALDKVESTLKRHERKYG